MAAESKTWVTFCSVQVADLCEIEMTESNLNPDCILSPKQKKRKTATNSLKSPIKNTSQSATINEDKIIFSKRVLKQHYTSLQHSTYLRKHIDISLVKTLAYKLSKVVKENHSLPVDEIVFIKNMVIARTRNQINLYDNENFGSFLDIVSHYSLPGEFGELLAIDWVVNEEDILIAVLTSSEHLLVISVCFSTVIFSMSLNELNTSGKLCNEIDLLNDNGNSIGNTADSTAIDNNESGEQKNQLINENNNDKLNGINCNLINETSSRDSNNCNAEKISENKSTIKNYAQLSNAIGTENSSSKIHSKGSPMINFISTDKLLISFENDFFEVDLPNFAVSKSESFTRKVIEDKIRIKIDNHSSLPQILLFSATETSPFKPLSTITDKKLLNKTISSVAISEDCNFIIVGTRDGFLMRFDVSSVTDVIQ